MPTCFLSWLVPVLPLEPLESAVTPSAPGLIDSQLTPGGQRRFDTTTLRQASEPADRRQNLFFDYHQIITKKQATKGAIYCRVSSGKQKDDLQRQIETMQEAYPGFRVYKDVASGLNYKRKGLQRLLGHCQEGVEPKRRRMQARS